VHCLEESGIDWTGSDELTVTTAAFTGTGALVDPLKLNQFTWSRDDLDSGTIVAISPLARSHLAVNIGLDQSVDFVAILLERDSEWVKVGAVITLAAVGTACALTPPCAALATTSLIGAGASAGVAAAFVLYAWEISDSDKLGAAHWRGTPAEFGERFTASHAPGFQAGGRPGPLPLQEGAGNRGTGTHTMVPPNGLQFEDQTRPFNPLETDSGGGQKRIGFREHRGIADGGAHYLLQFLWQRIRCDIAADCEPSINPDPARP
jgi:hypothetical protein